MALSVRRRFEVFKRDDFTCRYCGRKSPAVVLEVDHIQPVCEGGCDDEINLVTACWECNRGKSGVPLADVMTGEDPHDKAIELLERERQLGEYNTVLARARAIREEDTWALVRYWKEEQGYTDEQELMTIARNDYRWLMSALEWCPVEVIRGFMDCALLRRADKNLRYVKVCCRNWRYERMAIKDQAAERDDF